MAPILLKATSAGFHFYNGPSVDDKWWPDIFGHHGMFLGGRFIWDGPSGAWRAESGEPGVQDIVLEISATFPDPLSDNVVAHITAATYWRYEGGQRIKIGEMVFPPAAPAVVEGRVFENALGQLIFDAPGQLIAERVRQDGLVFHGGNGADYLDSDAGYAVWLFREGEEAPVLAYGYGGADHLIGTAANDTIYGGSGADTLHGGELGYDRLFGGGGDDILTLNDGGKAHGGAGNDRITIFHAETNRASQIFGGAGNDILYAYDGRVTISGGSGRDYINGSGLNDQLHGDQGNDTLFGGAGRDTLSGNDGNDELYAGDGNDALHGDAGADWLAGGFGNDTLYGGAGHDGLLGEAGRDVLSGDDGNDTLYGGEGADLLMGDAGNDWLYAGLGADSLFGGAGRDVLFAYAGQATLDGGAGRDTLHAEDAGGQMTGGADADVFVFGGRLDKHWVITDFENDVDTIRVPNSLSLTKWHFIRNHAVVVDGNTVISLDGGGTITLLGLDDPELLRNDLVLI